MDNIVLICILAMLLIAVVQGAIIPILNYNHRRKANGKILQIMESDGLSFEDARDKLLTQKIGTLVEIERAFCKIGDVEIKQGYKIGYFHTDDNVYINGDFIGVKDSGAEGYTEHICIRTNNKILYEPIEVIDLNTLKVYER